MERVSDDFSKPNCPIYRVHFIRRCAADARKAINVEISTNASKQKDLRNYPKVPKIGADSGSRTHNLLVTNEMLCH